MGLVRSLMVVNGRRLEENDIIGFNDIPPSIPVVQGMHSPDSIRDPGAQPQALSFADPSTWNQNEPKTPQHEGQDGAKTAKIFSSSE